MIGADDRAAVRRSAMVTIAMSVLLAWPLCGAASGRPVSFPSQDGVLLVGEWLEAERRPAPAVVLVHMLGRTHADWAGLAEQLAHAGISALAIDLRGHGASQGTRALPDMVRDVGAAVAWLGAQPAVRPDALGVVGASLGANLALLAAVEDARIRVVAAISPSLDYRGVRVSPDLVRRLGERGVWLAASTEDPYALRTLRDLAGAAEGAPEQQLSAEVAHGTALLGADPFLARSLVDWLRQRLLS